MKQKLLKPPAHDREVLFRPALEDLDPLNLKQHTLGVAHQPGFFHPGISLKFLLWHKLKARDKKLFFVDTDKTDLMFLLPEAGKAKRISLVQSDRIMRAQPNLTPERWEEIFRQITTGLQKAPFSRPDQRLACFQRFKKIMRQHSSATLLKEALVRTFLEYYAIDHPFSYVSDLLAEPAYREFVKKIYLEADRFRQIFNTALDEYKQTFRFRFKNFPFPRLEPDELPFWQLQDGRRKRLYKSHISPKDLNPQTLLPRASTLTLYLRLYSIDVFIHGIGGGNYEWIQDRLLDRFFGQPPQPYIIASGTFLLEPLPGRDWPYFFFEPHLKNKDGCDLF